MLIPRILQAMPMVIADAAEVLCWSRRQRQTRLTGPEQNHKTSEKMQASAPASARQSERGTSTAGDTSLELPAGNAKSLHKTEAAQYVALGTSGHC